MVPWEDVLEHFVQISESPWWRMSPTQYCYKNYNWGITTDLTVQRALSHTILRFYFSDSIRFGKKCVEYENFERLYTRFIAWISFTAAGIRNCYKYHGFYVNETEKNVLFRRNYSIWQYIYRLSHFLCLRSMSYKVLIMTFCLWGH